MVKAVSLLEEIGRRAENLCGICQTCGNLVQPAAGLIGCQAHDKLILPEYPPYHGNMKCRDWKPRTEEKRPMTITEIVNRAHENAVKHGFWEPAPAFGTAIALIHSELSEALEEERADRPTPYFPCNAGGLCDMKICGSKIYNPDDPESCSAQSKKPEGVAVELADAVIRIADLCGHLGIDLEAAIALKMDYNETRPFKHGKKF